MHSDEAYVLRALKAGARGYLVKDSAEGDLIARRMIGSESDKETVLPVLVAGTEESSFPHLLQGRVYADLRSPESYFPSVFRLILGLYEIRPQHPVSSELRQLVGA